MTNTLPFLPIHLQNLIFSYTRPVYPFIKELKEKEEERQREIDRKIKNGIENNISKIKRYGYSYLKDKETDLSFNMYIKNMLYKKKIYNFRWGFTNDTEPFEWDWEIAQSGGSINYFKLAKRIKRQKEIHNKFKFMIDYYNKHKTSEDYEWNPEGEDKGTYMDLGLSPEVKYRENFDYIMDIKRTFRFVKNYDNLKDVVYRINRLNVFNRLIKLNFNNYIHKTAILRNYFSSFEEKKYLSFSSDSDSDSD